MIQLKKFEFRNIRIEETETAVAIEQICFSAQRSLHQRAHVRAD